MQDAYTNFWKMGGYSTDGFKIYRLTGEKAASLLHGQFTNHVNSLQPGRGNYNLLLTNKGKVTADAWVYRLKDAFYLFVPQIHGNRVFDHLQKFAPLSRVTVEDLSTEYAIVELFLPNAIERVHFPFQNIDYFGCADTPMNNIELFGFRSDRLGFWEIDLLVKRDHLELLLLFLKGHNLTSVDPTLRDMIRIEQGTPAVGVDATDANLPQESLLDSALHFDKGCYLGQEIIARLHYKGHVNKILAGFKIEGEAPAVGDALSAEGKEIGKITSVARSAGLNSTLALGYVAATLHEIGAQFKVGDRVAQVIPLPISRQA